MAIGEPKTKLVDGMRIPVDSLTALAKNAGVENEPITPSIDASQLDEPRSTPPPTPQRSSDQLIASIADVTSGVADDTQLTREEDELRKLIRQQSGETEYRSRLEGRADIDALEKEIADIGADIKNRRAALTKGLVDTEGRPIASTFIVGRQAQQQRLAAAEIEGLEAAQSAALGNLAVANSKIDRAVQAKYGAIREEIGIQQQLLQLRQQTMTREEKKLAEKRQAELTQLESKIAQAQSREKNAYDAVMTAISNGFSAARGSDLLGKLNKGEIEPQDVISAVGGRLRNPVDVLNEQIKIAELEAIRRADENTNNGLYTPDQAEAVNDLTNQLRNEPAYKEMFEIRAGYNTAKTGFEQNNGFGDIAMVNGYQRMIDPGATVRGEDIKTQAEAVSYVQQALGIKGQVLSGDRFTPAVRKKLNAAVESQYSTRVDDFNSTVKSRYERVINRNPNLSSANVTFDDIGDSFSTGTETVEPVNPETLQIGAEFILDGTKYIKTGQNAYELAE